jgi:hypothetical protein
LKRFTVYQAQAGELSRKKRGIQKWTDLQDIKKDPRSLTLGLN